LTLRAVKSNPFECEREIPREEVIELLVVFEDIVLNEVVAFNSNKLLFILLSEGNNDVELELVVLLTPSLKY